MKRDYYSEDRQSRSSGQAPGDGREVQRTMPALRWIIAGGILLVTIAMPAAAAGGKIALLTYYDGYAFQLCSMNPDGSDFTRLITHVEDDYDPAWSPDGTKIAFGAAREDYGNLYVVDADGSGEVRLTSNSYFDCSPAWSPNGTKIAFVSDRDGSYQVYIMNADGSDQTRLTTCSTARDRGPAWSPDGTRIAFSSDRDGNDEIYAMDTDGSHPVRLTTNTVSDHSPAWSPDGTRIAFVSNRDSVNQIYLMNTDGSGQARLITGSLDSSSPAWSPDGRKIVFGADGQVYTVKIDGSNLTRITNISMGGIQPDWYGPAVKAVTPKSGIRGTTVKIPSLAGRGFQAGANVTLVKGVQSIRGKAVTRVNPQKMTCRFRIPAKAKTGKWNVNVTNPDGQSAVLAKGFTVKA